MAACQRFAAQYPALIDTLWTRTNAVHDGDEHGVKVCRDGTVLDIVRGDGDELPIDHLVKQPCPRGIQEDAVLHTHRRLIPTSIADYRHYLDEGGAPFDHVLADDLSPHDVFAWDDHDPLHVCLVSPAKRLRCINLGALTDDDWAHLEDVGGRIVWELAFPTSDERKRDAWTSWTQALDAAGACKLDLPTERND